MTNKELADHLNATVSLTGKDAVTVHVIRQWVDWDVLSKAKATGRTVGKSPSWSRDSESLRRAVRLAELRKAGLRRKNAVVAQAYFEWGHPDFGLVRDAVLSEFRKMREQLNRRQTTFLGKESFSEAGAWKQRAIQNQRGPLDKRFIGTSFEQTPEFYALFFDAARTGETDASRMASLLGDAVSRLGPELEQVFPKESITVIAPLLVGLTGNPDEIENSGEATIQNASRDHFERARKMAIMMTNASVFPEIQSAIPYLNGEWREWWELHVRIQPQISIGIWIIFSFVQALHILINTPEMKQIFPEFVEIIDNLTQLDSRRLL